MVALVDSFQEAIKGYPAVVNRIIFPSQPNIGVLPLVRVVVVDPYHVEVVGLPPQFGMHFPRDHVPRFPLAAVLRRGSLRKVHPAAWRHHMDGRLGENDARPAIYGPNGLDGSNGCAN